MKSLRARIEAQQQRIFGQHPWRTVHSFTRGGGSQDADGSAFVL